MKYIEPHELICQIEDEESYWSGSPSMRGIYHEMCKFAIHFVKKAKLVDAVEVVRCKDCKRMKDYNDKQHCEAFGVYVNGDDYCSHGVKKDGVE